MKPDIFWHYKHLFKQFIQDIKYRVKRVDVQAFVATWEIVIVDLSMWQGKIDFAKLATKVDAVIMRAGYGNDYFDPRVDEYRRGCREYGIPFGLYWFVKPGKDFRKHAENFYIKWSEDPGNLPPVFDLEDRGGLNKTALESWWQKMYNRFVEKSGLTMEYIATYTSPGFLNNAIGKTNWLKNTLLWVAHWTTAAQPIIPKEWLEIVNPKTWKFWQWSATGKGSDYGVSSRYIDLDRYNGTRAQFEAEFGLEPLPPPPGEKEMKYKVLVPDLSIRSDPYVSATNKVGTRTLNEIIIPIKTSGDKTYPGAYWALDEKGWSAVQYYSDNRYLMEPFV